MKLTNLVRTWEATKTANLILLVVVGMLAVLNAYLVLQVTHVRVQRELIPPMLDQPVKIGYAKADSKYYKAWGLYVAELVGNLTPGNAPFVAESLGRLFTSNDAAQVRSKILSQGKDLADNGVVMFFKAENIIFEPDTGNVFVVGDQREVSPQGTSISAQQMTYQMHIGMAEGQPVLTRLETYPGQPHTLQWLAQQPKTPATPASAASSSTGD